jgi:SAM-dependent methyltransferase
MMSSQHHDREQDHPDIVREEYADPSRFAARWELWSRRTGPAAYDVAFDALLELEPKRVIELGCGPGDFAVRVQAAGMHVVAFDQSEQMVELARACGVDARVGTVEAIPSVEGVFDAAVANFMLYHVAEVGRALGELARVAPALVAATMGYDQLHEMWNLVGRDLGRRQGLFMRETGEQLLRGHYPQVRMIDLPATVEMSADDMRNYIANSVAHRHLASRVPDFEGTRAITASTAVFIASNARRRVGVSHGY